MGHRGPGRTTSTARRGWSSRRACRRGRRDSGVSKRHGEAPTVPGACGRGRGGSERGLPRPRRVSRRRQQPAEPGCGRRRWGVADDSSG
jgi:hypothetical protein